MGQSLKLHNIVRDKRVQRLDMWEAEQVPKDGLDGKSMGEVGG